MKKTLIAIAAIAAVGAASAQVTLYGKLDAGISSKTDDSKSINQSPQIGSSNYEGSRIGVKGTSDIAGGVKGMFQVEGGLGATDGAFTSFNRVTKLGLSGGFGAVQAGLDWSPYDNAFNDAMEYNGFSAMSAAFAGGVHADAGNTGDGNTKNSIQYTTPSFGGLNAVLMYANGGDATAATPASAGVYTMDPLTGDPVLTPVAAVPAKSASSYTGLGVNYSAGALAINFANEAKKPLGDGPTVNAWILAGSYNLGVATVHVAAETADAGAGVGKDTGTAVGVSMPVNKATTVALGYATEKTTLDGKSDGKTNSTGVQVVYAWNAATALYAGYRKTDTTALDSTTTTTATKFATGVRYNF